MRLNEVVPRGAPGGHSRHIAMISLPDSPPAAPGCGQDACVANLARELARAGSRVDMFTRRDAPGHAQVVQVSEAVRLIRVPAGPAHPVPQEALLPHMDHFARFVTRFNRRLAAPYDIVHAHSFVAGLVARQLRHALGIPYVISFHTLGDARRAPHKTNDAFAHERSRIETALMREADHIIAGCAQDRLDMEQLHGAPPGRITVAPQGFDPDELWPVPRTAARAQLGLAPGRFTLLQLGRLLPRKGIDTAIQALAMLRGRHGVEADLWVVGGSHEASDNAELARLIALSHQLGVNGRVHFAGQQPRTALRQWYGAADVCVATPWHEPFGITPVEAMACARPVIGAEVGGIKSTVVDGLTGFLIPSRDPRALAERLALLHADPALGKRMGEEGLLRAWRHYTWRAIAQQACTVYATVLEETRPGIASGFTPF